jgi:Holliday junction resolvase-like predicted endonuclease
MSSVGNALTILKRELLVALLEQTRDEPAGRGNLRGAVRMTDEAFDTLLDQLTAEGLLKEKGSLIEVSLSQRLEIAVRAIKAGADFERVNRALGWREFEEMVAYIFEENGYRVSRRFRFQAEGRRWEIDVLATRKPLVVCAECKHWSRGLGDATARKIVETHLEKVRVLSENPAKVVNRLRLRGWKQATFIPITLSLNPARSKIYRRIPVVSVFELPRFLSDFEGQLEWLVNFKAELPPTKAKPSQTTLRG